MITKQIREQIEQTKNKLTNYTLKQTLNTRFCKLQRALNTLLKVQIAFANTSILPTSYPGSSPALVYYMYM